MRNVDALKTQSTCHTFVFSDAVMAAPFLDNFKRLNITTYDGKGDPATYMEVFLFLDRFWKGFKVNYVLSFAFHIVKISSILAQQTSLWIYYLF